MKRPKTKLIHETFGGAAYEYYPIGTYIVAAPGVCGGRPTFKYTRLEVAVVLDLLATGWTIADIVREYAQSRVTPEAVAEALRLAKDALLATAPAMQPATQ